MANILIGIADPDERGLVIFALRFAGHQLAAAATAEQLFSHLRQSKPDLVVVDAQLSQISAAELQSAIAIELHASPIPVIYLVDPRQPSTVLAGLETAGPSYVLKPISADRLTRTVNASLKNQGS